MLAPGPLAEVQAGGSCGVFNAAAAACGAQLHGWGGAGIEGHVAAQRQATHFSSVAGPSYWDATIPYRAQLYSDLATARHMLPHRSAFAPAFTPHGVHFIPERPETLPLDEAPFGEDASAAAAAAQLHSMATALADAQGGAVPLHADSVKRKRRVKMRKHKYRKRMKELRQQNK